MLEQLADLIHTGNSIFAIVDTARSKEVRDFVSSVGERAVCLYKGKAAVEMAEFAPYLVAFGNQSEVLFFLELSWGKSWGIMLRSLSSIHDLREFFRQFLIVQMPNGKHAFFRFYDPRVFRDVYPNFTEEEKDRFCDIVDSFFVESSCSKMCLVFRQPHPLCKAISLEDINEGVSL